MNAPVTRPPEKATSLRETFSSLRFTEIYMSAHIVYSVFLLPLLTIMAIWVTIFPWSSVGSAAISVTATLLVMVLNQYWKALNLDSHSRLSLIAGLMLAAVFGYLYEADLFSYDLNSHLRYITWVYNTGTIPHPRQDWMFYHPPTYYWLAAQVHRIAGGGDDALHIPALMTLSFALYALFLTYGVRTIIAACPSGAVRPFLVMLLCFWPFGISAATRINNDVLMYAFSSCCIYHMVVWVSRLQHASAHWCCIWASLAVVTKMTAAPLLFVCGVIWLATLRTMHWNSCHRRMLLLSFVIIACSLTVMSQVVRTVSSNLDDERPATYLGPHTGILDPELIIDKTLMTTIAADPEHFINTPFFTTRDDSTGRQYFLTTLVKSSLFGEFIFPHPEAAHLVLLLHVFGLLILVSRLKYVRHCASISPTTLVSLLLLAVYVMMQLGVSRLMPGISYSCGQDFRYIFPAIIPILVLLGRNAVHATALTRLARISSIGMLPVAHIHVFATVTAFYAVSMVM